MSPQMTAWLTMTGNVRNNSSLAFTSDMVFSSQDLTTENTEKDTKPQSERKREFFLTSRKRKRRKAFPSLTLPARKTPGPIPISVWPQKDAKDGLCTKTPTGNRRIMTYVEFQ